MRIYLDNCCYNRSFDDQSAIRIKLETDAKLHIQFLIKERKLELAWSFILEFENEVNLFRERRQAIIKWKQLAVIDISENDGVLKNAEHFYSKGLRTKDALHLACALESKSAYLLTTDDQFIKKASGSSGIKVVTPIDFIKISEENAYNY